MSDSQTATVSQSDHDARFRSIHRLRSEANQLLELFNDADTATSPEDRELIVNEAKKLRDEMKRHDYIKTLTKEPAGQVGGTNVSIADSIDMASDLEVALDIWQGNGTPAAGLTLMRRKLTEISSLASELVILGKLDQDEALLNRKGGQPLSILDEFDRDLPAEPTARATVLNKVLVKAGAKDKWIAEPNTGFLYRSGSRVDKFAKCSSPVATVIFGALFLFIVSRLPGWLNFEFPASWQLTSAGFEGLIESYVVIVAGATVHMLVESSKQYQADRNRILPIGDGFNWLYLRWGSVVLSCVWMLVGVFILRMTGLANNIRIDSTQFMGLCFFTGYSLNSAIGIWVTRFDASGKTGLTTFKDLVKSSTSPAMPTSNGGVGAAH